jgi:hypothetical protein
VIREVLVYAVAMPMLAVGVVLVAAAWPWRSRGAIEAASRPGNNGRETRIHCASAIAFATAYLVAHLSLHGRPASSQLESWEWLLLVVPFAAVASVAQGLCGTSSKVGWAWAVALSGLSAWLLVPTFQESPWLWRAILGGSVLGLMIILAAAGDRIPQAGLIVSWVIVGSFGLPVLIASANAKFGFFSTSIAASSGSALFVWLWRRSPSIAKGAIPVIAVLFPSIILSGHFNDYGDVPTLSFTLLTLSPATVGAGVPFGKKWPWLSALVGCAAVIGACLIALVLAAPHLRQDPY